MRFTHQNLLTPSPKFTLVVKFFYFFFFGGFPYEFTEMQLEIHSNAEEMLTTANKTSNLIMEDRQSFQIKFITLEETIKQGFKIMNRGIFMALCIIIIILSIPCTIQVIKEFQL